MYNYLVICCLFRSIHPTAHKCLYVTYLFNLFMFFKYMLYKLYIQLLKSISHCFHPNQSLALPWPVKQLVKNYSCNFSSFKFKLFPVVVYVQMYFKTNWLSHFRSAWHHTLKGKTVYLPKKENSTYLAFCIERNIFWWLYAVLTTANKSIHPPNHQRAYLQS